ncbi:DUF1508 domain-containing protein [Kaistella daneshvariae]|uniref:DUF1508 domain-containing protein n=1 Tax=Kaistella daneshvariae TaxID=2487074 RepID=A0ABN5T3K6_9FLAO|nr:YegP family protein [Kaistella daneshvariae]AZI68221.1 DUF1508 domain-containing protein [Kaistella daneshvariae]
MGKFVISSRKNGAYHFNLKAGNGHVILSSESYKSKTACQNGIESVKKNAANTARFEKISAPNGKFYFTLKASNGQVLGTSEMYETLSGLENGIESVQTNSAKSTVVEE